MNIVNEIKEYIGMAVTCHKNSDGTIALAYYDDSKVKKYINVPQDDVHGFHIEALIFGGFRGRLFRNGDNYSFYKLQSDRKMSVKERCYEISRFLSDTTKKNISPEDVWELCYRDSAEILDMYWISVDYYFRKSNDYSLERFKHNL